MTATSRPMVLAVVLLVCLAMRETVAESCRKRHPQEAFCKADFVIKAKIQDNDWKPRGPFSPKRILVKLETVYKGKRLFNGKGSLAIIQYTSMSTPPFQVGDDYLLTGKEYAQSLSMSFCDRRWKWSDLPTGLLDRVRHYYKLFCDCTIKACYSGNCKRNPDGCNWDRRIPLRHDNTYKSKYCARNYHGHCEWFRIEPLDSQFKHRL